MAYKYQLWALGYDKNNICIEEEVRLALSDDKKFLVDYADNFNDISYIYGEDDIPEDLDYMEVVIEEVVDTEYGTESIDNTHVKTLYLPGKGEYN